MRRITALALFASLLVACGGGKEETPDGGGGGGNDGGTTGAPADAMAFCTESWTAVCERAWGDCGTEYADIVAYYTDAQECIADHGCVEAAFSGTTYHADRAGACMDALTTWACTDLIEWPPGCDLVTTIPAPDRTGCTEVSVGSTTEGVLADTDPLLGGAGRYDTYCVTVTNGQSLNFTTAAGAATPEAEDTVVYLFDETGAQVAWGDDIDEENWYTSFDYTTGSAGSYLVVVSGYDPSVLGGYTLSITAN